MIKRIKHVAPLQTGIVLAALYGIMSLIVVPFLLLASVFAHGANKSFPILLIIFLPVIYAIVGFVGGVIAAAIYNLIAGWTGGIEMTLEDVPQKLI